MKQKWIVRAKFADRNQSDMVQNCDSKEAARVQVVCFARQFNSLRGITIDEPNGDRVIFYGSGDYFCTVPASAIEKVAA